WPDALVVHRLDMATSGLLLMARGKEAQRRLGIAFADRAVRKRYVAVVTGRVDVEADAWMEIDLPLMADWPNRPMQKVDVAQGKPSLTRLRSTGYDVPSDTTRVVLEPITGRTHQLRVHLQAIGHPIVGDGLYGTASSRLMLHASELWLAHPFTKEALHFVSAPTFQAVRR
ncbi:MAG: pseudouridine synthase, partial [Rhizobacter sp.]|nr:pseudouridine synthase [Rhizobacter sp.]